VSQVLQRGGILARYRSIRANPPLIDDPSGEFGLSHSPQLPANTP